MLLSPHKTLKTESHSYVKPIDIMPAIGYNLRMAHVYSVEEAAQKLGLEASHVRRLLRKGEIKGRKLGHDWAVLSLNYQRKRKPKTKPGEKRGDADEKQGCG